MSKLDKFLGVWELDSSQNIYQTPTAPKKGSYEVILLETNTLKFEMHWTDADDHEHEASYTSIVDGNQYPYENPELADFIETTLLNEFIMQTASYKDGKLLSKGTRELVDNNRTMLVSQETFLPGQTIVNKSIYYKQ